MQKQGKRPNRKPSAARPRVGRNEPCPAAAEYKQCCGKARAPLPVSEIDSGRDGSALPASRRLPQRGSALSPSHLPTFPPSHWLLVLSCWSLYGRHPARAAEQISQVTSMSFWKSDARSLLRSNPARSYTRRKPRNRQADRALRTRGHPYRPAGAYRCRCQRLPDHR